MNKKDFTMSRIDKEHGHEDYWFKVTGETQKELENEYMEMSMLEIPAVVYSKDEDVVGIERLFPFNPNVVLSEDEKLKALLKELVENYDQGNMRCLQEK